MVGKKKEAKNSVIVGMACVFVFLLDREQIPPIWLLLGIVFVYLVFRKPRDYETGKSSDIKAERLFRSGIGRVTPLNDIEDHPEEFVILDFETTGLDLDIDQIVEVAALSYRNGILVDTYATLINPQTPIPSRVTRIHGINNKMVRGQPKLRQVIDKIYRKINGKTVVGYHVSFDIGFLEVALKRSGKYIENVRTIDVLEIARDTIPYETDDMKLATLKKYFGIKNVSHRSKADCEVTFEVFKRCLAIRKKERQEMRKRREEWERKDREIQKERMAKLNDMEKHFISTVQHRFTEVGLNDKLRFNILASKVINFTINNQQIGRVKLNGRIYKILDAVNDDWIVITSVDEAICHIPHWINYAKRIL